MKTLKLLYLLILFTGFSLSATMTSTLHPSVDGVKVMVCVTDDIQAAAPGTKFPTFYFHDGSGAIVDTPMELFKLMDSLMRNDLIPDMLLVEVQNSYSGNFQKIIDTVETKYKASSDRVDRILGGHSAGAEVAFRSVFKNYGVFSSLLYIAHPLLVGPYDNNGITTMNALLPNVAAAKAAGMNLYFSYGSTEDGQLQNGTKHAMDLLHDHYGFTYENELAFTIAQGCGHVSECVVGTCYKAIWDTINNRRERLNAGTSLPIITGTTTLTDTLRIDFMKAGGVLASGFIADTGVQFKKYGSYYYGWDHDVRNYMVNTSASVSAERKTIVKVPNGGYRIKNVHKPSRLELASDYFYNPKLLKWEIALQNGKYWVRLKGGDPSSTLKTPPARTSQTIDQNHVSIFEVEGHRSAVHKPTVNYETYTETFIVEVVDGRLTINNAMDCLWGSLASVEIMPVPSATVPNGQPHFNINWIKGSYTNVNTAYTNDYWVTEIREGGASESAQTLTFELLGIDSAKYSVAPTITYSEGNYYAKLNYTPATGISFADTVVVKLTDNGGTGNGGKDCFARMAVIEAGLTASGGTKSTLLVNNVFDCDQIPDNMVGSQIKVSAINISTAKNTNYTFSSTDFTNKYQTGGKGALSRIKFTALPSNGTLKLSGTGITVGQEISEANILNLVYVPNTDYQGTDNATWTGGNTSEWAVNTAGVSIAVGAITPQTITFKNNPDLYLTTGYIKLNGTASSGLPVSYSVLSGTASVSNDTLYSSTLGTVIVQASQAGNGTYLPASNVNDTIIVKASQVFTTLEVNQESVTVQASSVTNFTAIAKDQDGVAMSTQPTISWTLSSPDAGTVNASGQYTAGTTAGAYKLYAQATQGTTHYDTVDITVTVSSEYVKINFETATFVTPSGYKKDKGDVFGDRGNGFSYGWNADAILETRARTSSVDPLLKTIAHFNRVLGTYFSWEIEVPNGTYSFLIACGDPSYTNQTNSLQIEGVDFLDPDGQDNFDTLTGSVTVSDGRLSIEQAASGNNAKICFIELSADVPTLMSAPLEEQKINLWPNPASDIITISSHLKGQQLGYLYTIEGLLVKSFILENSISAIYIGDLRPGLYIIDIAGNKKRLLVK